MSAECGRWVFCSADSFAHVLADDASAPETMVIAMCGLTLPGTTPVYSTPPSLAVCVVCEHFGTPAPAPPEFPVLPTPDSL
ncbi:MAG: hypothetical protein ACRDSP_02510 [Pseudonocardiaceae bacterium]